MPASPDEKKPGPAPDDAGLANPIIFRADIFAIEGNGSLRAIGVLAIILGICSLLALRFAPRLWAGALKAKGDDQSLAAAGPHAGGDIDPMLLEMPQSAVDFFLKAEKPLLPKAASKPMTKRAPAASAPIKTAPRKALILSGHTTPDGSQSASDRANVTASANLARDTTRAVPKPSLNLEGVKALSLHGDQLKKRSDYAGAKEYYRRALEQNPNDEQALAGMADLYRYSGLLDSALGFYRAALAVNPRNPETHDGFGTALYENSVRAMNYHYAKSRNIRNQMQYIREQYDSALVEYGNAIALDSHCVQAYTNRGVLRDIHNDHRAALQDYSQAIRIPPSNADAYSKRADTYKDLGKLDSAVADYSAAIKLDSGSYEFDPTLHFANAYFGRGTVHYRLGKLDAAIADFDSALALSPRHSLAMVSKGVALADQRHYELAIAAYTQAISWLTPTEYDGAMMLAYLQMGNAWKAMGKYDTARADYQKAMDSPNLAAKACWRIAECFSLQRNATEAIAWLEKAKTFRNPDVKKWVRDGDLSFLWDNAEFKEMTRE